MCVFTCVQVRQQVPTSLSQQAVIGSAKTTCWQVVGTALGQVCCRFVTSCAFWRVLLAPLVGTDLSTQNCYKPVETALLQLDVYNNLSTSCSNKHGTACCHQSWYKLFQQLATGLQANNLSTSCWRQLATTCWLNKLVATCSTSCYKLVKPTTCWQDVRFYVCSLDIKIIIY